ncbi:MAG: dephospho-CoA kinase [Ignavibacterium sp.]|nr:MAG: dephospho-CoA kinase [Ignavibacterium sp.]
MSTIKVAITGNIGSGKSTFADYLSSKGYPVLNADSISKEILSTDEDVKAQVITEFGTESFAGGKLNNKFIADKVFSVPENLDKLNSILHPKVLYIIDSLIESKYKSNEVIFVEAALIYEVGIEKSFDYVVLIIADYEIRLQRSISGNIFTEEEFEARDRNQIPQEEKEKRADFTFRNNGSEEDLFNKADLLLLILN